MRLTSFALIISSLFTASLMAESVTASFAVGHVQCGRCAKAVSESLKGTKGVAEVKGLSAKNPSVKVTFDPAVVSFQQVALAVAAANPVHGTQYDATMSVTIPDYSKNADKINAAFAKDKDAVKVDVVDKDKGLLAIHFLELKEGAKGWNLDSLKASGVTYTIAE